MSICACTGTVTCDGVSDTSQSISILQTWPRHLERAPTAVTAGTVKRLLKDLVPTKAPGPDDITPSELKMVADKISSTVSILFNESLSSGLLPTQFKMAKLFPLLKPGKKDTSLPSNHRGISLTCILSKVMEKIVHEQVTDYLTECGALSEDQYGFRKGRSCPDLLLTAVDDWCLAKDAKQYTAVAFVDLSKAFDCVRHDLLLQTLQSHGLGGTVLKWFHHYLTDRQQCIMLQDPPLTFNCSKGVPQGSVLGPLLFNLYVSDVGRIAKKLKASLPSFADDFTLYASRATPVAACRVVSETLTELKDALEDRGLVISCEKTVAMLIPPNPHLTASFVNCTITCGDTDLKFVHQTRLLGIIVDSALSWSAQVDNVCRKVGRKIGALRRSFRQLTQYARRKFLLSVIQPDLEYAAFVYVPLMSVGLRSRLEAVWRRAVRCAAGASFQHELPPLLKEMNLTDIRHRWIVQYLTFTRRCHIRSAPPTACAKLSSTSHCHATRGNAYSYRPFRASRQAGTVSFSNRAPLLWNALSPKIRETSSPAAFKQRCLAMLQQSSEHEQFMTLCLNIPQIG